MVSEIIDDMKEKLSRLAVKSVVRSSYTRDSTHPNPCANVHTYNSSIKIRKTRTLNPNPINSADP